jgi:hypothetical protein
MNDDFFIGWSENPPKRYVSAAKLFFGVALLSVLVVAYLFVKNQKGFIHSVYDFSGQKEYSGYLVDEPVWGLSVFMEGERKTIPLVGFGKNGADQAIDLFMSSVDIKAGSKVTLRGTVFHYQDKYWMELTDGPQSLVSYDGEGALERSIKAIGHRKLTGEIVDPKCFFGVMNPATKAVHRSCAIRCISGGIPPLLAIRENGVFVDYYFVNGADGDITNRLLPYVGIPVSLSGLVTNYDDWKSITVDPSGLKIALTNQSPSNLSLALCL